MSRSPLVVRRQRPLSLSDPFDDFSATALSELLEVPDAEMAWQHYQCLLGPFLPAGSYEESVYFLPKAFDFIIAHDENSLDLITPIVWFVSAYDTELASDGLINPTRDRLRDCFDHWITHFRVRHFDDDACLALGRAHGHFDLVGNIETICQGTSDLVRFEAHEDLAIEFVTTLAHHGGDSTKAAWFLEYARSRNNVYSPPVNSATDDLLTNRDLLVGAAVLVRETIFESTPSPTYWKETFAALDL